MSIEFFGGELLKVKFNSISSSEVREFLIDYLKMVEKLRELGTYELSITIDQSNRINLNENLSSEDFNKVKSELFLLIADLNEITIYSHYSYIGGGSPGEFVSEMLDKKANIEILNVDFFEYKSVVGYDVDALSDCCHYVLEKNMIKEKTPVFSEGINFPELENVKYWFTNNFEVSFLHPEEFPEIESDLLCEVVEKIKDLADLEEEEDENVNQIGDKIKILYFSSSAEILGYDNVELLISYLREIESIQSHHVKGFLNVTISFVMDDSNLIADVQLVLENNKLIVKSRIL